MASTIGSNSTPQGLSKDGEQVVPDRVTLTREDFVEVPTYLQYETPNAPVTTETPITVIRRDPKIKRKVTPLTPPKPSNDPSSSDHLRHISKKRGTQLGVRDFHKLTTPDSTNPATIRHQQSPPLKPRRTSGRPNAADVAGSRVDLSSSPPLVTNQPPASIVKPLPARDDKHSTNHTLDSMSSCSDIELTQQLLYKAMVSESDVTSDDSLVEDNEANEHHKPHGHTWVNPAPQNPPRVPPPTTSTPISPGDKNISKMITLRVSDRRFQTQSGVNERELSSKPPPSPDGQLVKLILSETGPRLLAEIAFQLDRRIVSYIFKTTQQKADQKTQKRFYGYMTQNVMDKIKKHATDATTGKVDKLLKYDLEFRYQYIMKSLKPFGYNINIHPEVCADLINGYGLLPIPSEDSILNKIKPEMYKELRNCVGSLAPPCEENDVAILLNCLVFLAKDDRKPVFVW